MRLLPLRCRRPGRVRQDRHRPAELFLPCLRLFSELAGRAPKRCGLGLSNNWTVSKSMMDVHHRRCGPCAEHGLIDAGRFHVLAPILVGLQQCLTQRITSLLTVMPITAQLFGGFGHRPTSLAHRLRRPSTRPAGQPSLRSNRVSCSVNEPTPQPEQVFRGCR